jgi:parallel beta-helix repeat protein
MTHDIDKSNTVNGKPIYYIYGEENLLFDENMEIGYLFFVSCRNITVRNLEFSNNNDGISMIKTTSSIISNCTFHDNGVGVGLGSSRNIKIINCTFYNNDDWGGIMQCNCTGCDVINCTFYNNGGGVFLCHAPASILNCTMYNNGGGIFLHFVLLWNIPPLLNPQGDTYEIHHNDIYNSSRYGIAITYVRGVNITRNDIHDNFNGLGISNSVVKINYNNIYSNTNAGIMSRLSFVDARNNWWGSPDGPSGRCRGNGDAIWWIMSIMLYKPWLKGILYRRSTLRII